MAPVHCVRTIGVAALAMHLLAAGAQAPSRGELLYATHCGACHSAQIHWRAARAATDWPRLLAQVRKWQDAAALGWTDADIVEVARYLNEHTYHFEHPGGPVSGPPPIAPRGPLRSVALASPQRPR